MDHAADAAPPARTGLPRRLLLTTPVIAATAAAAVPGSAQRGPAAMPSPPAAARALPARTLPVPDTVSPALRARIAAPYPPAWDTVPRTAAEWRALAASSAAEVAPHLPAIRDRLRIRVEADRIAGVGVFVATPEDMPPENRDRVLLHVHGGGYVLYPGEAGAGEAMLMAGYGRFRVVSVDYRMPPDFPFPAALDDAMAVWRALLGRHDPRRTAIFGSSAGGGLTLAMILRARMEGLPLPAAIAPGTPWSDLTGDGDSVAANAFVDNVLVSVSGWVGAAAALYAGGRDLRDPLLSPIYGDFAGFPPAILTTGTRDLFLSNTVRTHRKLRQAGVEAELHVFEGQSHAQFLDPFVPETEEAFGEIARFLRRHLQ
jgi:epsilon-lactone hydrolase